MLLYFIATCVKHHLCYVIVFATVILNYPSGLISCISYNLLNSELRMLNWFFTFKQSKKLQR